MALTGALCYHVHAVTGFTNKSLRGLVAGLLGPLLESDVPPAPTEVRQALVTLDRRDSVGATTNETEARRAASWL
jgi:hypothetical protein